MPGPSVFPSGEPGVSGDFWGSLPHLVTNPASPPLSTAWPGAPLARGAAEGRAVRAGLNQPQEKELEKAKHLSEEALQIAETFMYGCESWTVKKAERRRIDAFELCCWRRLLRVPWTARRSNQSILKEISPEYSLEGLMLKLKLQYFGQLV